MPISVVEVPESRQWRFTDRWGESTLELHYRVVWIPAPAEVPPTEEDLFLEYGGAIPVRPQKRIPSAVAGSDVYLKEFVVRSITTTPMRERPYSWDVRAQCSTYHFGWRGEDVWGSEYVKQTRTTSSRKAAFYRLSPTMPANGDVTWPGSVVDIAGTKVDTNGNPQTRSVAQQYIQIEYWQDRTPTGSGATTADDPNWTALYAYINKRNSAAFLGWPIGTVLCTGATATLDNEWWRVSVTFVYDEMFHLVQVPIVNATGAPVLNPGATLAGQMILQTDKVGFYQEYPTKIDFNNAFLSPTKEQFTKSGPPYV
jgi:hypothetical protein